MRATAGASELGISPRWLLIAAVLLGLAVRVVLLPARGYEGDMEQFVAWTQHIAAAGLPNAYDQPISFGPVMAYIWAFLAAIDPAILRPEAANDPAVRVVMKLPAVLADFGLAGCAWYVLRDRPRWAAITAAAVLGVPVTWLLSSWWGQYDSIYLVFAALAYLLAVRGRDPWAVVAMTLAVMAKPQAIPLVVPLAAWIVVRPKPRSCTGVSAAGVPLFAGLIWVALVTTVLLWLPFLAADGPANYVAALAGYQAENYGFVSNNAWNLWWPIQEIIGGGAFVPDDTAILGPLTYRVAGYVVTAVALIVVGAAVFRRPTSRQLLLGMAAASLVAFSFLTTMHERYAYAGVVLLLFLLDDRRLRWLALGLATALTFDLLAGASARFVRPAPMLSGPIGLAGSAVMVGATLLVVAELVRAARPSGGGTPPDTSAGSEGATSGA